jgi:hypothetical protein
MRTTKNNVRYIVVHSTQTLPHELHHSTVYHYIIHRNGKVAEGKKLLATDGCIQIAYLGGVDKERNILDTKTEKQSEVLYNTLVKLSGKHSHAKIVSAEEIFGKQNNPGFDVKEWLKTYIPASIKSAA